MNQSLQMLDNVLPWVIIAAGLSLSIFLVASGFYSFVFLQKKANLKKSKDIIEENRQEVEEATFFAKNKKFQAIIEEQLEQIKKNAAKNKSLLAELDDMEEEKKRRKKKS